MTSTITTRRTAEHLREGAWTQAQKTWENTSRAYANAALFMLARGKHAAYDVYLPATASAGAAR